MEAIPLSAILSKATTTVDGGWKITFDIGEDCQAQVLKLCEHKNELLQLVVVPVDYSEEYGEKGTTP